jgi:tRNA threonylcarbamoyladenosine biosynthesis protein TsaE
MEKKVLTKEEVEGLAREVSSLMEKKPILCLKGDLGAGKTFFASNLIKHLLGENNINITSPTFSMVNIYKTKNGKSIHHFDLYRLKNFEDLEDIGFFDAIQSEICIIEWWNIFEMELKNLLHFAIFIDINNVDKNQREFIIY